MRPFPYDEELAALPADRAAELGLGAARAAAVDLAAGPDRTALLLTDEAGQVYDAAKVYGGARGGGKLEALRAELEERKDEAVRLALLEDAISPEAFDALAGEMADRLEAVAREAERREAVREQRAVSSVAELRAACEAELLRVMREAEEPAKAREASIRLRNLRRMSDRAFARHLGRVQAGTARDVLREKHAARSRELEARKARKSLERKQRKAGQRAARRAK